MIGTIQGGTVTCAVPAECRIAIDRRVIPGEDEQAPERQLQHILDECRREDPEFEGEVRSILKAPAMEIAAAEPIVLRFSVRRSVCLGSNTSRAACPEPVTRTGWYTWRAFRR